MLTRETIEAVAREQGAAEFGVGDLALFEGEDPRRDPKMICPKAQCIVGFGIPGGEVPGNGDLEGPQPHRL